jgi:hypothetical protein
VDPRPDGGLGNYGGGEVGNYVGVKPLQLGNYFGADTGPPAAKRSSGVMAVSECTARW